MMNAEHRLLINHLVGKGVLRTPRIIKAFQMLDRREFVKPEFYDHAYEDKPLPISSGQTISQPSTVAFMLEKLQPEEGEKILDVGSGSGWSTALLAQIVGPKGMVHGTEIMPDLVQFGTHNISKFHFKNVSIVKTDDDLGLPNEAPFDRIVAAAFATELPLELLMQVKIGGTLVMPIKNSIVKAVRTSETEAEKEEFPGFVFVPLIRH